MKSLTRLLKNWWVNPPLRNQFLVTPAGDDVTNFHWFPGYVLKTLLKKIVKNINAFVKVTYRQTEAPYYYKRYEDLTFEAKNSMS